MKIIFKDFEIEGTFDECLKFLKKYKGMEVFEKPIDITPTTPSSDKYRPLGIETNPCEGCPYFEEIKGDPTIGTKVGDTPCTWCTKRNPRVVYMGD